MSVRIRRWKERIGGEEGLKLDALVPLLRLITKPPHFSHLQRARAKEARHLINDGHHKKVAAEHRIRPVN
jgi:hypothetical protein